MVLRSSVRFQVNTDKVFSGDHCRVIVYNYGLGENIVGWGSGHPTLLHLCNAAQGDEDAFGAPVAAATEGYFMEVGTHEIGLASQNTRNLTL